jgi:hypothetical protein
MDIPGATSRIAWNEDEARAVHAKDKDQDSKSVRAALVEEKNENK